MAVALREYEDLLAPLQRATTFAELRLAAESSDRPGMALLDSCELIWQTAGECLGDFEREIACLPDADADALLSCWEISEYANHLRKIRAAAATQPSPNVARLLPQLDSVGGWETLSRQLLGRITVPDGPSRVSLGQALPVLYETDADRRGSMCAAISDALAAEVELRATVLVMITRARRGRDAASGVPSLYHAVNLDNQVSEAEVDTLLGVVRDHQDMVHRYYRAKSELAGQKLSDADRYAPVGMPVPPVTWPEACDIVLAAFARLGDIFVRTAREVLDDEAVDALPRPGKRRGALTFTLPGGRSFVLVNFTGKPRDVLTLAHELGHAVHGRLAGSHGVIGSAVSSVMAETVGLFTEAVAADTYRQLITDPEQRRAFLARWTEDQFTAIFRQTALHDFEMQVYAAAADNEASDCESLSDQWIARQRALYGPAVALTSGYRYWWSYLDSYFLAPGSGYSYAYGHAAASALMTEFAGDETGFGTHFATALRVGGTRRPAELLAGLGVRVSDLEGWRLAMRAMSHNARAVFDDGPPMPPGRNGLSQAPTDRDSSTQEGRCTG